MVDRDMCAGQRAEGRQERPGDRVLNLESSNGQ